MPSCPKLKIELHFSAGATPVLTKAVFHGDSSGAKEVFEFTLKSQKGDTGQVFDWKSGTKGFVLALLDYRLKGTANSGLYAFSGRSTVSPAASACNVLEKQQWILEAFGYEGNRLERSIAKNVFRVQKIPDKQTITFLIDSERLSPTDIRIYVGRGLKKRRDIEALLEKIAWRPHRRQKSVGQPVLRTPSPLPAENSVGGVPDMSVREAPQKQRNPPDNLPEAPVRFFGYEKLRKEVTARLNQNDLIVLHDIGGIGKTTFANQVAHDALLAKLLPGGAVWINCSPHPRFNDCLRTMTEVLLGSRMEGDDESELEQLFGKYAARQHTLIVFDNFETVLSDDGFNKFLTNYAASCNIVITTREIHDGMKPHVLTLDRLDPESALQLFLYEAGLKTVTEDERATVLTLCETIGHVPLAILLLARQAPKITLGKLVEELRRTIDLLATDDAFLDVRHRSMKACFLHSFELLNGKSREVLFRLCVIPNGLHKQFAADYLGSSYSLSALTVCLHSALLRLENDRYSFHPLIVSLLQDQLPQVRRGELEDHFMHYFCERLNEASQHLLSEDEAGVIWLEVANCKGALEKAAWLCCYSHYLVVWEYAPQYRYYAAIPGPEPGEDWEFTRQWLKDELARAEETGDAKLQERLLALIWDYHHILDDKETLAKLARLNPLKARALALDRTAWEHIKAIALPSTVMDMPTVLDVHQLHSLQTAEKALAEAYHLWAQMRDTCQGELEACLLNLLAVRTFLKDAEVAAETASVLWDVLARSSHCITEFHDYIRNIEWARSEGRQLEYVTNSPEERKERFWRLAEGIGKTLFQLEQWAAAEPWLKEVLTWKESDQYNDDLPIWESALLPLAEVQAKLGRLDEAENAFYAIARSISRREGSPNWYMAEQVAVELNREAHIEIAKIEAQRGDYDKAIERASDILEAMKHGDFYPYADPTEEELKEIVSRPEFQEIIRLITEWKRRTERI